MKNIIVFCFLLHIGMVNAQCVAVSTYAFDANANDGTGVHNGVLYGSPIDSTGHDGIANTCYAFDGIDDYILVPENFDYPQKTISLWFKANTIPSAFTAYIFTTDNPSLAYGLNMAVVTEIGGVDYLRFQTGSLSTHGYDHPISENTWYHLAMVMDLTETKYYLNCTLVATQTPSNIYSTINPGDSGTLFGCDRVINRFLDGFIDNVSIYNCSLTDLDICSIYNSTKDAYSEGNKVELYPNPVKIGGYLDARTNLKGALNYTVYSANGSRVSSGNLNEQKKIFIDETIFVPGMYIVEITDKQNAVIRKKIIVD